MRSGAAAAVLMITLCAVAARANESGRIGYSGKQSVICNACHSGGTRPTVRFEGPTELEAGATARFRFALTSAVPNLQDMSGFNVAASAGALHIVAGQKERLSVGELTHSDPKAIDKNDESAWEFDWTAPAQTGQQTLYGAGNSVNGNGNPTGDRAAATTLKIDVVAAGASPTASPTPSTTSTVPVPSATPPASSTPTTTSTPTAVATATATVTLSPTATATMSRSPTEVATATVTSSVAPSVSPTFTELPTATPTSSPVPSASPTIEPATPAPSLTPTSTPSCDGDCDGDQRVSVAELVTGVNIALDRAPLSSCTVLDRDGDGRVTVAELVAAVRAALLGCLFHSS